jgi:hypothetical protein
LNQLNDDLRTSENDLKNINDRLQCAKKSASSKTSSKAKDASADPNAYENFQKACLQFLNQTGCSKVTSGNEPAICSGLVEYEKNANKWVKVGAGDKIDPKLIHENSDASIVPAGGSTKVPPTGTK